METDKLDREVEERIWREAEKTRQNDEERHRRERDARERERRDALLRQIQAEARIENQAPRVPSRPVATLAALAVSALLALVGFGTWLMHAEDVAQAQRSAVLARAAEAERASTLAQKEVRLRFEGDLAQLRGRLAAARPGRP
jgi:hypothetical protein